MTKKTLVTVVTANRFMAETIARAIGATSELEGYYHGNGYAVTWTNGEIIESEYKHGEKFVMNSGQDMRTTSISGCATMMRYSAGRSRKPTKPNSP